MAFHPEHLPITVFEVYKQGPVGWMLVIQTALQVGIRNIDALTNIAFYLHHPELDGRPLRKDEIKLIAQWKGFRTGIKPLLSPVSINNSNSSLKPVSNNNSDTSIQPKGFGGPIGGFLGGFP